MPAPNSPICETSVLSQSTQKLGTLPLLKPDFKTVTSPTLILIHMISMSRVLKSSCQMAGWFYSAMSLRPPRTFGRNFLTPTESSNVTI